MPFTVARSKTATATKQHINNPPRASFSFPRPPFVAFAMAPLSSCLLIIALEAIAFTHALPNYGWRRQDWNDTTQLSPNDCPGYTASKVMTTDSSLTADLTLASLPGCNVYGEDIVNLKLLVEYQTSKSWLNCLKHRALFYPIRTTISRR